MNDKALTIKEPKIIFNPEKDTNHAKKAADKLIDIVKQNNWAIKVGNGEHLMYEAWQTVGKYYNVTVATGEVEPVELNNVPGFKAKAWVIDNRTGIKVGEAEAYCVRDEYNWKTKPLFQLASMAQTRAGSKALRQIFGFVVALAGYNATPAEEMDKEEVHSEPVSDKKFKFGVTTKQINMIDSLLVKKGYIRDDLYKKYKVNSMEELDSDTANKIISNLRDLQGR